MTDINIYRATVTDDIYGDPQPAVWSLWKTLNGKSGWGNSNESVAPGRNTVITNRTVYIRGIVASGILSTDQVEIEGIRYSIDGAVAEWGAGTQFAVKKAT